MPPRKKSPFPSFLVIGVAACIVVALVYYAGFSGSPQESPKKTEPRTTEAQDSRSSTVELTANQLSAITIGKVETHSFTVEREAIGSVAYHEKEAQEVAHSGSTKFVIANVAESDSPLIHVGQPVRMKATAYPDRAFSGRVSALGVTVYDAGDNPAIDPNTHRITVRCEVTDPKNELYPGMLATIAIQVQKPVESVAIPTSGVVRKSDGTMTAWVTRDSKHFEERTVKQGLQQDGYTQILEGLEPREQVVTNGAIFISNILYAPPSD